MNSWQTKLPWLVLFPILVALAACGRTPPNTTETLVFAESSTSVPGSLPFIAREKGFWKQRGLDVKVASFSAGRLGFDAMLAGDAAISTLAETPLALAAFRDNDSVIIAETMQTSTETRVVARRSAGIREPADLRGKRIAVFMGTQAEYFLSVFLAKHGLSAADVEIVNLQPPDMVSAIARKDIAAMVGWQPHVARASSILKDDAVVFANDGLYTSIFCIATTRTYLAQHPEAVRLFLEGLIDAQAFVHEHRSEAEEIVARQVGIDAATLREFYGEYDFQVRLTSKLPSVMSDVAEWAVKNGKVPAGNAPPTYEARIATDVLRAIDPQRVQM